MFWRAFWGSGVFSSDKILFNFLVQIHAILKPQNRKVSARFEITGYFDPTYTFRFEIREKWHALGDKSSGPNRTEHILNLPPKVYSRKQHNTVCITIKQDQNCGFWCYCQCSGSRMFIPDPFFIHPRSWIPDHLESRIQKHQQKRWGRENVVFLSFL